MLNREIIDKALAEVQDDYASQDVVTAGWVEAVEIDGDAVAVTLTLGYPVGDYAGVLKAAVERRLLAVDGISAVEAEVRSVIASQPVQQGLKPLAQVKNIIAVASGKGGVGKSTTSVNLALALAGAGASVALLDADIYGPNQPRMLGYSGRPSSKDGRSMEPVVRYGVQSMSVGYLVDEEQPMIWRGPMVTQALNQILRETQWREVDYMIIDLPPGTGDIQLTLSQKIPVSGAIIVTTPQDVALLDARKALRMFERVEVAVLGLVENMSTHICSNCGHEEHIFGEGGGRRLADQYRVPFLGGLPLDIQIREQTDSGRPTVVAEPQGRLAGAYRDIALRAAARLAAGARGAAAFPDIEVADD